MRKGYLLKNGCVLSMDARIGQYKRADVLIQDSLITAIQPNIEVSDADIEVIDASDMIIMPGLVDTHRHMWESLVKTAGTNWSLPVYLQNLYYGAMGSKLRPQDSYIANLLGSLEALNAGVTTVLDWSMPYSAEHTDELIRGLQDAGIRAVFAHGVPGETIYWNRESKLSYPENVRGVKEQYFSSNDQLLTYGLAIRGPEFSHWDTTVQDIQLAEELDAICSMHVGFGSWGSADRSISRMYEAGLLGPRINVVHGNTMGMDEFKMLADSGASLSVTPEVEMMMGHGYPATGYFLEHGGTPTLGVDVVTSTGGDMFSQMKFALQAERSRTNEYLLQQGEMPGELSLKASQVLRFATSAGSRALGLEQKTGSLTPGKEADVIMIRTTDLNLFPVHDPIGAVVQFANPSNVDTVFVAGKPVKREGKLLHVNLDEVRRKAMQSTEYLLTQYRMSDADRVVFS
ncbi:amidohydrolase family protein [Paenibacillus cucumis (ex Kampfer et al. 2016)]|uniref:Amidohydrolase family protein n=1 Tax=Paenibacillus cucumis (ex Kampfer et al. 2016) TaxID=1776858 RepID=A0ABS7KL99_9BACL|nr:amidohydrolase family protein [Paenibacillus cucumis (ex Kampfer et al. 2016)]MBY0204913.1 amidohydrolase family protein [Paenibacillus cucumis (ex Kampfer et al. 2016)]